MSKAFRTKDGREFVVRLAVPGDAERLLAAARAVLDEGLDANITRADEFQITADQERTWIKKHTEADNSALFVAEHQGQIVGWVVLRGGDRHRTRHTGLLGITVVRPWRGRGVGTALMQVLIEWAGRNPVVEKIKLGVVHTNKRAQALYYKMGFVKEGRQSREFKKEDGTYLDNIQMYLFVSPAENGSAAEGEVER
ncbi:MAG: GNAT family N-acetyltransferase [Anaerolineae bacterium]|jgi:RimJ/RimL family protein N-acetyltransferase